MYFYVLSKARNVYSLNLNFKLTTIFLYKTNLASTNNYIDILNKYCLNVLST